MDTSNKLDIIRMSTSSYQGEDFQAIEKDQLESRFSIHYKEKIEKSNNHILITNSNTDISSLPITDRTKLIIHPNSGYDNFPTKFVKECPCPIIIGNEIRMNAVVNYTISALLNSLNAIKHSPSWDTTRLWDRSLLETKRILIIGQGHIGKKVNDIVKSLGGNPNTYDPYKGLNKLDFNDVDVILLCASLNKTSEYIINEEALKKVSKDLLLINGARGKLIHQQSLISFLKENANAFAYLDVFEREPFANDIFDDLSNMCRTSHIAGVHNQLNSNIIKFECKIIGSFLSSKNLTEFKKLNKDSLLQERIREDFLI